jgi:c-di-GMP-binding flagellar brake protein YcgR
MKARMDPQKKSHEQESAPAGLPAPAKGSGRDPADGELGSMPRPEPGICVRIRAIFDDSEGVPTRVVEVDEDRVLLRLPRHAEPLGQSFVPGDEVQLLLGRRDSAYVFHAAVLSCPEDDLVAVLLNGHPMRLQRREYFRLVVRLPIVVNLDRESSTEKPAPSGAESDDESAVGGCCGAAATEEEDPEASVAAGVAGSAPGVRIFRLADLSGGGCLCLDPDGLLQRGRLYSARLDLHDGAAPLQVCAEVVRRGISFGSPSVGLRFVALAEKHRERIMRSLFREHRRRATVGRT